MLGYLGGFERVVRLQLGTNDGVQEIGTPRLDYHVVDLHGFPSQPKYVLDLLLLA